MKEIELKNWLVEHIIEYERRLEIIKQSNKPDIIARRVVETQIMDYRNILSKLEDSLVKE